MPIDFIPQDRSDKDLLIYGKEYHVFREGKYLGVATFIDDPSHGDIFASIKEKNGENVIVLFEVDDWKQI